MYTNMDQQLAQIRYRELLQEAAEARADHKERMARPHTDSRKLIFALLVAIPMLLLVVWLFMAG